MKKRNKFSLSNYKLLTGKMGELLPIGLTEVLPGDTIQQATSALIRATPLTAPVMHPVKVRIHHWFVPHRIVWSDWENFITGGPDGNNSSTFPTIDVSSAAVGSLADYLGIPTGVTSLVASALPFRAYALIWNEFYRDQDLDTELTVDLTDGIDTTTNKTLKNVSWEKDYFTSCRAWEQKGTEVSLPLGTTAPVIGDGNIIQVKGDVEDTDRSVKIANADDKLFANNFGAASDEFAKFSTTQTGLDADLTNATAASINELREAFALQRYKEARARYGSRYTEYLRYLGIRSSDARLQRPEYLGGGRQTIQFSEVLQTGVDSSDAGVASLKGHGIGAMRSNRYRRFFEEHGYIVSVLSVVPKAIYSDGLCRTWNRTTKEDFYQKELEHIGQQQVLNKEVYASHSTPDGTFGYQDRYDEYRRGVSSIAGQMRDSTYNNWHFARIFGSDPALNSTFTNCTPAVRPFADQTNDNMVIMANHSIQARRMIAKNTGSFGV